MHDCMLPRSRGNHLLEPCNLDSSHQKPFCIFRMHHHVHPMSMQLQHANCNQKPWNLFVSIIHVHCVVLQTSHASCKSKTVTLFVLFLHCNKNPFLTFETSKREKSEIVLKETSKCSIGSNDYSEGWVFKMREAGLHSSVYHALGCGNDLQLDTAFAHVVAYAEKGVRAPRVLSIAEVFSCYYLRSSQRENIHFNYVKKEIIGVLWSTWIMAESNKPAGGAWCPALNWK